MLLSETHLRENETLNIEGYVSYVHNRTGLHRNAPKGSGGVGILIKRHLLQCFNTEVVDKDIDGIIGIKIVNKFSGFTCVIFCCYLPPENSVWGRDADSFFAHLTTQMYLNQESDVLLIGGDFNARIGTADDFVRGLDKMPSRVCLDTVKCGHGDALIEFLKEAKMIVLNGRVTPELDNFTSVSHRGRAVVDYFICDHHNLDSFTSVEVKTVSSLINTHDLSTMLSDTCKTPDHSLLILTLPYSFHVAFENRDVASVYDVQSRSGIHKKVYDYSSIPNTTFTSGDWLAANQDIIDTLLASRLNQDKVDGIYATLCKSIFSELDANLQYKFICSSKTKKRYKNSKPYWDEELTLLWNDMNKKEKYMLNNKEKSNIRRTKNDFKYARNTFDKALRKKARQYNYSKISMLEQSANSNHVEFWNKLKQLGPRKSSSIPLTVKVDGTETSDINTVKKKWETDFSELLNPSIDGNHYNDEFLENKKKYVTGKERDFMEEHYQPSEQLNASFTTQELKFAANKLKEKKALGIDLIANEILKCETLHGVLLTFFQTCFKQSVVPSLFKKAIIKPIPKSSTKDPYLPLSYRGISLISCVSKLYSCLLNNRLIGYCNENSVFAEEQNGFRANRSCEDHIFVLNSIIENRLNEKRSTYCAFIDLEKAFDWLNRDLLFSKLIDNNIDGEMYFAIKSLLSATQSKITLSGEVSTAWFDVSSGVRQGDPLSPTLFSLFINDFVTYLKDNNATFKFGNHNINSLLYADDMVLFANSEHELQTSLNLLSQWCYKWRIKINDGKSQVVHFRKSNLSQTEFNFKLGDVQLEKVKQYKYLGVIFDENLKFENCVKCLADSGGRALGGIINKFKLLKNVGFKTFTTLFKTNVLPVLHYGCSVWGYKKAPELDIIENRAMRYYLGVHRYAPVLGLAGDMGWYPLYIYRYLTIAKFWNRLIQMEDTRLTKAVFLKNYETRTNNWCSKLQKMLNDIDSGQIFDDKSIITMTVLNDILREQFENKWKNDIALKPKLRTYCKFKTVFETEEYVTFNHNRKERSLLAQFRLGILPLCVETGRYTRLPLEERVCFNCNGIIEDEKHFLLDCPVYNDLRLNFLDKVKRNFPNFDLLDSAGKLNVLLNNSWKECGKYVNAAWELRQNVLYNK